MAYQQTGHTILPQDIADYDVIYYRAKQDHNEPKNRPFIVVANRRNKMIVAPITHTPPGDSIYDRYNLKLNDATQKYLTSITKDRDHPRKSYIAAGHVSIIPKNKFYKVHNFPRKLGNLADNVPPKQFRETIESVEDQCKTIAADYARGKKLYAEHTDKEIKNDPELSDIAKHHTLSAHAYRKLALSKQDGLRPFFPQQYYPAMSQGRFEAFQKQNNKKIYKRHPKHQDVVFGD